MNHDTLSALILGAVEGLTEFLPVSSTGHLILVGDLLNFQSDLGKLFEVVIQLGAILAVVAYYFNVFWKALIGLPTSADARRFALGIILALLPAVVGGLALKKFLDEVLLNPATAMPFIAGCWIVGGIIILVFERLAPKPRWLDGDKLPLSKAFQIGCCQVLAIIPGVSRSGATILGGELLGVDRRAATLFTFYLAVPTMLGASILELHHKAGELSGQESLNIAVGFAVSFVVAYFVIKGFLAIVTKYGLKPFGWYRIAAGLALIAYLGLH